MTGQRHAPSIGTPTLRISRAVTRTAVLGPGMRAAVWVQGCDLRCRGCILPEGHDRTGGTVVAVPTLAQALLREHGIDGVTLSGGEPFMQPGACAALIDALRVERPALSA